MAFKFSFAPKYLLFVSGFVLGIFFGFHGFNNQFTYSPSIRAPQSGLQIQSKYPRIMCIITTQPSFHMLKAIHVKKTWASRCDQAIFVSSKSTYSIPTVVVTDHEGRENLWNKTRASLHYVHKHFGDSFDFFYKADDDTYALIDNLKRLLKNYDPGVPVLLGQLHMVHVRSGYPSGGAGYVLSRMALQLVMDGLKGNALCQSSVKSFAEDVKIALCAETMGVRIIDSRDSRNLRHFHCYSPFMNMRNHGLRSSYTFISGSSIHACCSDLLVALHYIKPEEMYFLDYLLYQVRSASVNVTTGKA